MTTRRILASFLLLVTLLAGGAAAQTPDGPPKLIIPLSENNASLDDVAMDGAGNVTFLWTTSTYTGVFEEEAFTRRFAADGTPLGGAVRLAPASVDSRGGSVAANQRGDYVVTWSRIASGVTHHFLRWRSPLSTTTFTLPMKGLADVAIDNAGNFVAVWTAATPAGTRVFGQRYRANGTKQGPEFNAATSKTGNHVSPSVAMNPNTGEFVVVWEVRNDESFAAGIRGQRFGFFTGRQGSELVVYALPAGEPPSSFVFLAPNVERTGNGNFVVVWKTVGDLLGIDVVAQRYDNAGAPLGGRIVIADNAGIPDGRPRVAMAPNGRFVVSWDDQGTSPQWVRLFRPNGTPFGPVIVQPPFEAPYNGSGRVAFGKNGSFVLGWTNYNDEGPSNTVSFQLFDVP